MKETILAIDIGSSKIATIIATYQNKNMDILGISIGKNKLSKENLTIDFENHQNSIKNLTNDVTSNLSVISIFPELFTFAISLLLKAIIVLLIFKDKLLVT